MSVLTWEQTISPIQLRLLRVLAVSVQCRFVFLTVLKCICNIIMILLLIFYSCACDNSAKTSSKQFHAAI